MSPVKFQFYLDMPQEKLVSCRAIACYGEREYSVYDLTEDIDRRDLVSESEAARILSSYCNTYDDLKKEIASSSVGIKPYENEKREYFYVGMMNHPGGGRF